jgi:hypothetical protein
MHFSIFQSPMTRLPRRSWTPDSASRNRNASTTVQVHTLTLGRCELHFFYLIYYPPFPIGKKKVCSLRYDGVFERYLESRY